MHHTRSISSLIFALVMMNTTDATARQGVLGRVYDETGALVLPTAGYSTGFTRRRASTVGRVFESKHQSMWFGVAVHPRVSGPGSWFFSGALELESFERMDGTRARYGMPLARAGVVLGNYACLEQGRTPSSFNMLVIDRAAPCAKLYGIAGYRPGPAPERYGSWRAGIGGAIFPLSLFGQAELIFERDPYGNTTSMFRMGMGF